MPKAQRFCEALAMSTRSAVRRRSQVRLLSRASLCATTFLVSLLVLSPASAVENAAREQIRGVIEQQLQAFGADDGASAYAFTSPGLRQVFPSPEAFMGMVRRGYQPIYRSRGHTFGEVRETEDGLEQAVHVEDADGVGWTAIYSLEHEPDGSWAISGCRLVRAPDQTA